MSTNKGHGVLARLNSPGCERNSRMALSTLFGLFTGVRDTGRRSTRALHQRDLRIESLESRLALSTLMEVKVEATDLAGSPITSVEVGDQFVLRATVQDLRLDATGVFAAYADVIYDPTKVAVNGDITHGALYPNGVDGDTSTPGLIDDAGGFFNCTTFPCFGDGEEELLFSVPFVATAAGTVSFDVGPPNDPTRPRCPGGRGRDARGQSADTSRLGQAANLQLEFDSGR